jgi:hypothetical protein
MSPSKHLYLQGIWLRSGIFDAGYNFKFCMDKMIALLSGFSPLSGDESELIRSMIKRVHLVPGQFFGPSDRGITFLHKGIILARSQRPGKDNRDRATILIDEGNFLTYADMSSVSDRAMQSLTVAELMVLDNRQCEILSFLMPQWDKIMDVLQIMVLTDRLERFKNQTSGGARLRYLNLIERYPTVAQQVPLRQIALWLGITSQSLSRIRNELAYKR